MYIADHHPLINCQPRQSRPAIRAAALAKSVTKTLRLWRSRIRERHSFHIIDERDLRDAGLSQYDMQRELAKPFWRG